jgi:hypothetical protein
MRRLPSRTVFPSPSPGFPSHPRARLYRRYLEVVRLRCSASTCCPHLVSTVTGVDRRLGCGPVTRLVRGGPSPGLAGLVRTGLSGSSLPVPLGPGPAILHARSPEEDWAEPGTHWRGSPPWAPAADGSPVRLPQRTRNLFRLASRCEREQSTSERLQAATSQGPIPASPSCCVPRRPGQAAASPLPPVPVPVRPEDCQSGVSTPQGSISTPVPQTRQRLV